MFKNMQIYKSQQIGSIEVNTEKGIDLSKVRSNTPESKMCKWDCSHVVGDRDFIERLKENGFEPVKFVGDHR